MPKKIQARLEGRKRKKYHAFTHVLRKILMRERVKKHHPCRTSPTACLKWKDRPPRKAENINLRSNANIPITRNSVNPKFWQTLAYVSFGLPRRRMWRKCCFNLTFSEDYNKTSNLIVHLVTAITYSDHIRIKDCRYSNGGKVMVAHRQYVWMILEILIKVDFSNPCCDFPKTVWYYIS